MLEPASAAELRAEQKLLRSTDARYAMVHRQRPHAKAWKPEPGQNKPKGSGRPGPGTPEQPFGVFYNRNAPRRPYIALFSISNECLYLGTWKTIAQAALARDRAALHYHGPDYPWFNDRERALKAGPTDAPTLTAEAFAAFKETTSSRFRGVTWHRGAWNVMFCAKGETKYHGRYSTEEEAARAWDKLAFKRRGWKAKLNFHPRTHEELRGLKRLCDIDR